MRTALRRHDAILRAAIEAHRGYVFKTIGDAFCAAFWTIGEALEAAVEAQRGLEREDFGAVDGLRVRIAVHVGETDERDGDYFGAAVNRAARLLTAGHGGQILVSGVAADLAIASLLSGVTLRALGTLPLKDLKEPERVYQAIAADLNAEFKALRTVETPPNNLPRQTTSFVGRYDDVARIRTLLHRHALVTVVGAGGVGKTRLALAAASDHLYDVREGAWFVDFSSIANAALVESAIRSALGADEVTELDGLLKYLAKQQLLLVLDNCEHILDGVVHVAAKILAACAHVTILATSREALDVSGECVYRIASLDSSSAIRLFCDRALAVNPAFQPDVQAALVEDICRRLDGIALAIELAAARVRSMPVEALSRHLELRMLSGGRDRWPRQQTMRALIDWSYDLLSPEERMMLRLCSVFAGGFTLATATDVCSSEGAGEWRALELLSSLVDKSLLIVEGQDAGQRYRLLEPIRQYARERLEEKAETPEALRRHAIAYATLARADYEEWDTDPQPDWLVRVEKELDNVRAALRWAIDERYDLALGAEIAANTVPAFLRLSLLAESIDRCERVLEAGVAIPVPCEARLRYGLSMLYNNQGVADRPAAEAQRAASLYRRANDPRGLARALSQVAQQYANHADFVNARSAADEALELARRIADRRLLAGTLQRCASAFLPDGIERVRSIYAESVELFGQLGHNDETARALTWWAQSEAEAAEYRKAAERSLEARRFASDDLAVHLTIDVVSYYLALDDRKSAEPIAREALSLAARVGHPICLPYAILYVAAIAGERSLEEAARLLGYAQEQLRIANWRPIAYDETIINVLRATLNNEVGEEKLRHLLAEGAAWTERHAVNRAAAISTV